MNQQSIRQLLALTGLVAALSIAPPAAGGSSAEAGGFRACPEQRGALCKGISVRPDGDQRHKQRTMIRPLETRDSRGLPAWSSGGHVMQ